jgi:hypothetical protein
VAQGRAEPPQGVARGAQEARWQFSEIFHHSHRSPPASKSWSEPAGNYAEIDRLSRPFRAFVVDGPTGAAYPARSHRERRPRHLFLPRRRHPILIPLFGILWALLFLHEPVTLGLFAGLGVILASVWLVMTETRNEAT